MGIVIDYRGKLNEPAGLDSLIADVRIFCQQIGWKFDEVSVQLSGIALNRVDGSGGGNPEKAQLPPEEWPEEETFRAGPLTMRFDPKNPMLLEETWHGIVAYPEGTDPLSLTFDGEGRLCRCLDIPQQWARGPLRDQKFYLFFPLFCKTTGEIDQHVAICALLQMLRRKHIRDLKVHDETGYFESLDLGRLRQGHAMMAGLVGTLKGNPAFLQRVLQAAGLDEPAAGTLEVLPGEIPVPLPTGKADKKDIVH